MASPAKLLQFNPIFLVKDLNRALEHYKSLGFAVKAYQGEEGYGFADRDGVGLHLSVREDYDPTVHAREAYVYVDDADALFAEWSRPGISGKTLPVHDTDYKLREGGHIDLDNNLLRFGSSTMSPGHEKR